MKVECRLNYSSNRLFFVFVFEVAKRFGHERLIFFLPNVLLYFSGIPFSTRGSQHARSFQPLSRLSMRFMSTLNTAILEYTSSVP